MKPISTVLAFAILFFGCSRTDNKSTAESVDSAAAEKTDTTAAADGETTTLQSLLAEADGAKAEVIDFDCVIEIYPSDEQIEKAQKEIGEDGFNTTADDAAFYSSEAIKLIDSLHIKTVPAKERYITLKGQHGSWTLDLHKEDVPSWNLIFFSAAKEPKIVSTMGLTADTVKTYFEGKE